MHVGFKIDGSFPLLNHTFFNIWPIDSHIFGKKIQKWYEPWHISSHCNRNEQVFSAQTCGISHLVRTFTNFIHITCLIIFRWVICHRLGLKPNNCERYKGKNHSKFLEEMNHKYATTCRWGTFPKYTNKTFLSRMSINSRVLATLFGRLYYPTQLSYCTTSHIMQIVQHFGFYILE